jgi:hypothetical protein
MKTALFLLLLSGMAWGQVKPFSPEMCKTKVEHASPEYVKFCISHSDEYPSCPMNGNDPREAMWVSQANGGKGAYYEVLDCSWHSGKNPRDSMPRKKVNLENMAFGALGGSGVVTSVSEQDKSDATPVDFSDPSCKPVDSHLVKIENGKAKCAVPSKTSESTVKYQNSGNINIPSTKFNTTTGYVEFDFEYFQEGSAPSWSPSEGHLVCWRSGEYLNCQSSEGVAKVRITHPAKRCAFDLKRQFIVDQRPVKPRLKDEMFPQPPSMWASGSSTGGYPMRQVCPYERAIELFGEDRVTFEEKMEQTPVTADDMRNSAPGTHFVKVTEKSKHVLVDGEVVYEEK